jgi:LPS-assembly protein
VRADAYNSDHLTTDNTGQVTTARGIPMASLDWRYPFTRLGEHSSQTISPIVVTTISPYGGNSGKIPNEDSLDFELDDSNIFKANPGTGYDQVLTGPRIAYGGEYTIVNRGGESADFLLAQSYQLHPEAVFPQGSGLDHHASDIVGRSRLSPSGNFSVQYSFRADEDKLTLRRSEITTSVGPKPLNLTNSYVFYDRLNPSSLYDAREELDTTLTAQLSHYWSTQFYTAQSLGSKAAPLQTSLKVIYEDECFSIITEGGSLHTTVNNFVAGHYLTLSINFKTLGQIPVDIFGP